MTVNVELSDRVAARLQIEADRRGVAIADVITALATALPTHVAPTGARTLAFMNGGVAEQADAGAVGEGRHADPGRGERG